MPPKARDWTLSEKRLERLLNALDPEDAGGASERYNRLKERLVLFFEHNTTSDPYRLADVTLDRLAVKLDEVGLTGREVEYFALGLARKILLEDARERQRWREFLQQLAHPFPKPAIDHECLERAFQGVTEADRQFLAEYYPSEKPVKGLADHRRDLALTLGISYDAIRVRAYNLVRRVSQLYMECDAKKLR
jgi:hypothetical protein